MRFLFMGKKGYFENLWIGKNNQWDFKPFPVILLDFNGITNDTPEEFKLMLGNALTEIYKKI
jgi:Predicted AAA-ATPase.